MNTVIDFALFLLAFVPFVGTALIITTVLWAATKLFPSFGVMVDNVFDALFGVTEEEPETEPEFRIHRSNFINV